VTIRRGQAYFGYKAHLAVDEGSGVVRQAEVTSANVHDFCLAEALSRATSKAIRRQGLAPGFRQTLERRGLIDGVALRSAHHPLQDWLGFSIPGRRASAAASSALTPR
jgi:IS5 family transposase